MNLYSAKVSGFNKPQPTTSITCTSIFYRITVATRYLSELHVLLHLSNYYRIMHFAFDDVVFFENLTLSISLSSDKMINMHSPLWIM